MEVIHVSNRPASQLFYAVAGRLLFVENIAAELCQPVARLFAGWQLAPAALADKPPDIKINFRCGESSPSVPDRLTHFDIAEGGRGHTDGADLYLEIGSMFLRLRQGTPVVVDVFLSELPGPEDLTLPRVASFAVCAALRRFGLFELHSAGLVDPYDGKGVLIIGPSGSGKSTLALNLALAGWSYLSDDELLLSESAGAVEARGFRRFFAVHSHEENAQFKRCFEPESEFETKRTTQTKPERLFFISLNGEQQSTLSRLTTTESMSRLIRACPWATYDSAIAAANLAMLSQLARQTSAFELAAGRDLLTPGFASNLMSAGPGRN